MSRRFITKFILLISIFFSSAGLVQADILNEVLKRGELRVAVSLFEPWVMEDENGNLSGFEIDVANKMAEDLGVKVNYKLVPWNEILDTLEKGEADIIIAGMAITPQRALRVSFSMPYGDSGISLATNIKATKDIQDLKQLNAKDIHIGTVKGTVSEKLVASMFAAADKQTFASVEELTTALKEGKLHAFVGSMPIPQFLALENPKIIDIPLSKPLLTYKAGMAVNKGEQEFLNYLNAWIISRQADAWLSAKHKYWFDSLDWRNDK